jgi:alkanesulfonate monooxygenase SsuD/methylene tetrahydromethanopterin reductase-like flavin-dependent oxidoreductase (luciferase family)
MDEIWTAYEKEAVMSRLAIAAIGSAQTVQDKLAQLLDATDADELMVVSDFYHHQDRLHSYEILAGLQNKNEKGSGDLVRASFREH